MLGPEASRVPPHLICREIWKRAMSSSAAPAVASRKQLHSWPFPPVLLPCSEQQPKREVKPIFKTLSVAF